MTDPLLSIIVATYNCSTKLGECFSSLRSQTNKDFELIVVDGGSTDGTVSLIEKNADIINNYVSEKDDGIYDAWNKGIEMSAGKWIMFLGSDDRLLPHAVDTYSTYISNEKLENFDYISAKVELVSETNKLLKIKGERWRWPAFKKHMTVAHVASLHSKQYFSRYGLFDASYKIAGDYELLLRAGGVLKYYFVDAVVASMTYGGTSFTDSMVFSETFRAKLESGKINYLNCKIDDYVARLKFLIKRFINYGK